MEIEQFQSEVEVNMDRIIWKDHNMSIIIKMTIGETVLEKHKITDDKTE